MTASGRPRRKIMDLIKECRRARIQISQTKHDPEKKIPRIPLFSFVKQAIAQSKERRVFERSYSNPDFFLQSGFLVQEKATNERLNNVKDRFFDEEQKRIGRNRTKAEGKIFEIPIGTFFTPPKVTTTGMKKRRRNLPNRRKRDPTSFATRCEGDRGNILSDLERLEVTILPRLLPVATFKLESLSEEREERANATTAIAPPTVCRIFLVI